MVIRVELNLNSKLVLETLADLIVEYGPPVHIRSDNGVEFIVMVLRDWLGRLYVKRLYIAPVSTRESGSCESFHEKFPDESLNEEVFDSLAHACKVLAP
ncbi:integrase core domain-containing protein [Maricaulis sp. D1M11]|uniref:integrase core domain-containing protein n=1 Tax=Maricaulis sp. D1M11 TaxID=3076117 RepID=UPI0039B64FC4